MLLCDRHAPLQGILPYLAIYDGTTTSPYNVTRISTIWWGFDLMSLNVKVNSVKTETGEAVTTLASYCRGRQAMAGMERMVGKDNEGEISGIPRCTAPPSLYAQPPDLPDHLLLPNLQPHLPRLYHPAWQNLRIRASPIAKSGTSKKCEGVPTGLSWRFVCITNW